MPNKLSTKQLLDFHVQKLHGETPDAYTKRCKERYNRIRARIRELRNAKTSTTHENVQALYQAEIDKLESLESTLHGRIHRPWSEH